MFPAAVDDESGAPGTLTTTLSSVSGASPCDYSVDNDGNIKSLGLTIEAWITPTTAEIAAFYQVKVDVTAGAFDSGTTGTWLDCSSDNSWLKSSGTVTFTISFREKYSGLVRKTQAGVTLQGT